jgi:hypothetical protein
MTEFKDLRGDLRPPTWAERDELDARKQDGITDVYVEPEAVRMPSG